MLKFSAIMLDGMNYAAWLFLVAVGLTLIYGVMRILNIAHGAFYAIGAYVCASALGVYYGAGLPEALAFLAMGVAALVAGVVLGLAVERGVLRFLYGRDEVLMVLVTYAMFLILEDAVKMIWGVNSYFVYQPYAYFGFVEIGGLPYQVYDLLMVVLAVVLGLGLWFWLERTRMGRMTTAVVADREISAAMGINVTRIFATTFAIGTVFAVVGGVVTAPKIAVTPGIGVEVIILAFAVVVIGGLGSIPGAAIGAIFAGYARALCVHLAPQFDLFAIYAVMAAVLAVRPHGLFAKTSGRKI
ncbi:branched-chain amino acid ABC transporter permease [Qingshengfaniella alkalisoli]|uniref:Branched-chain amino acid ABC transporter permease n=1 Tax=Qingshengfaniella alkalisoli TaxID=2599296 RepID=A0A5B8J1I0_9RHOB|nr:branched-chain amino acid ABC transporter permease [Qingshengfaniella alkalisoli]QDY70678.1 branched-chain amino acid ABC transporter permease [Qingshengfaniella alkalisoli]